MLCVGVCVFVGVDWGLLFGGGGWGVVVLVIIRLFPPSPPITSTIPITPITPTPFI